MGIGASSGIGLGRVCLIDDDDIAVTKKKVNDIPAEKKRFHDAVDSFCDQTEELANKSTVTVGEKEAEIIRSHIYLIRDPFFESEVEKRIENGMCAEYSFHAVCEDYVSMLKSSGDEFTAQRAADIDDIKRSVINILSGKEGVDVSSLPPDTVIVAKDMTPSMTVGMEKENVAAIITECGGYTSHCAILSRALGIPSVLSAAGICHAVKNGDLVIVDGDEGKVYIDPKSELCDEYRKKRTEHIKKQDALKEYRLKPTLTCDKRQIELLCNIGSPAEISTVFSNDGEGVGLFRTEFLFMDKEDVPSEEEQFDEYKSAALALKGKVLTVRTLDIGGDKDIPYLGLKKEENPFLGFRAIRYCLNNPQLYKTQLRALLRASAYGDIRILVPMISSLDELLTVRSMLDDIKSELDKEGIAYDKDIKLGIMIETPAAVMMSDVLAKYADFFSIGTNDLTQYIMATDRGNADVAYLYSVMDPAVLRAINKVIENAHIAGITVGMCGEAASDEKLIPMLVAMGLDEFSVNPPSVLNTRKVIGESVFEREQLREILGAKTVHEVKKIMQKPL